MDANIKFSGGGQSLVIFLYHLPFTHSFPTSYDNSHWVLPLNKQSAYDSKYIIHHKNMCRQPQLSNDAGFVHTLRWTPAWRPPSARICI